MGAAAAGWQQTFHSPDTDWFFSVVQEPQDSAQPSGTPAGSVAVGGRHGGRYESRNGTAQTIQWQQGGLTISVTGEMQGPPSFTHDAELLRVAQGVRLPGGG